MYFEWNDEYKELGRAIPGRQIGIIAQELEKEFPELVTIWGDGSDYRAVDYGRFTAVLLEGIKEQQKEIKELKAEIESLKKEIRDKKIGTQ